MVDEGSLPTTENESSEEEDGAATIAQIEKMMMATPSLSGIISRKLKSPTDEQRLRKMLEPNIRRCVKEEVELTLQRCMPSTTRLPPLLISPKPRPPDFRLAFANTALLLPIFTRAKILDNAKNPLRILLVNKSEGADIAPPFPLKVEIVALEEKVPFDDKKTWTVEQYNSCIVKAREGRCPLLYGVMNYTMREGIILVGDIEFTDNSSWIRCRKFRLGARVVPESCKGVRVLEAVTEAFRVRHHRGVVYKKHYPPRLEDEVWRLEKIGKDGKFHKNLQEAGIRNVQDFLKLSVVNATELRKILGASMSEKKLEALIKHAKTCGMGTKLYIYRENGYNLVLSPICQILEITINGQTCLMENLTPYEKDIVDKLVVTAYNNWQSLEEIDKQHLDPATNPPQGGPMIPQHLDCDGVMPCQYMLPLQLEMGGSDHIQATDCPDLHMEDLLIDYESNNMN
ncbi:hypothetical protein Droror1_Dr00026971 [Drosera rotundifolia]